MIKNDDEIISLCTSVLPEGNGFSAQEYIKQKDYNSARYIVSGVLNNIKHIPGVRLQLQQIGLQQMEDYLINKIEEEYDDRERI